MISKLIIDKAFLQENYFLGKLTKKNLEKYSQKI